MACGHVWNKVNDLSICMKCGLIKTYDNKFLFDRAIMNASKKRKKVKK